jgi:hypothetical protein
MTRNQVTQVPFGRFLIRRIPPTKPQQPDGNFGPATQSALRTLQVRLNAPVTGKTSAVNWLALLSNCDVESSPNKVKAFQAALLIPGYPQTVSGVLDAVTVTNLTRSRVDSGSSATGVVSVADWLTLVGVGD